MAGDAPCPDPEILRHFASGQLSETQAVNLKEHVRDCWSCTQVLAKVGFSPTNRVNCDLVAAGLRPVSTIMEQVEPFRLPPNSVFPKARGDDSTSPSSPGNVVSDCSSPTASFP